MPWEEIAVDSQDVGPLTPLEEAEFVALDVETTGNRPFLVLEIGAERFRLNQALAFFDTLVRCGAPINPYARQRHQIDKQMLIGAPEFGDAREAFLRFARGAVLVEHSHDAFDTWLVGRGLRQPLQHPIIDTTALARLVLDLPAGQTPGLARLVAELEVDIEPAHAALSDARATAAVFTRLLERGRAQLGWETVGDVLLAVPRPEVDRSSMEKGGGRTRAGASQPQKSSRFSGDPVTQTNSSGGRAQGGPSQTGQPRSAAPGVTPGATSPAPSVRRGRSRRRRRSGLSGSPGDS